MIKRNLKSSTVPPVAAGGVKSDGGRIPKTLQAVFLASNRGNDVDKPPPKQVAFKVFLRTWLGKGKPPKEGAVAKKSADENDMKEAIANSYQKKSKGGKKESSKTGKPPKPEKKIENPQVYLDHLMKTRGYCTKRYNTLHTAYHNKPTELQQASYDLHLIGIVKGGDAENLDEILKSGVSPNPCNSYGESLVHMVCRRGDQKLLQIMIQNGCDIQVADDYGRTPLHDACWAAEPAFDTVELLVERDLTLFQMADCRGFLPLSYVRKDHWPAWIEYFNKKKNAYWPNLSSTINDDDDSDSKSIISTVSTVSEFVEQSPNTRPLADPRNALPLDLAKMVASGQLKPEEAIRLRNKRVSKAAKPQAIDEEKELEESDEDDDSDDYDSDDDSEYDSDDYDEDDDDLTDVEMEELMGVLTIQLRGAETSETKESSAALVQKQ